MKINDRAIIRSRELATPLARLKVLAPRLLEILPDTIGGCAEKLGATRREVEDVHQFVIDDVCYRDGRLVARG
ncbi:hypothetical protein GGQ85_002654 [Nitrobacter vulgaris]|nr:hypothetical protein [Nitrobacter vulgaris]